METNLFPFGRSGRSLHFPSAFLVKYNLAEGSTFLKLKKVFSSDNGVSVSIMYSYMY